MSTVSASNAAATITYAGVSGRKNRLEEAQLIWSYSADPTGGRITISQTLNGSSTTLATFSITKGGPGFMPLRYIEAADGADLVITLAAGGSGIVGDLNVVGQTQR